MYLKGFFLTILLVFLLLPVLARTPAEQTITTEKSHAGDPAASQRSDSSMFGKRGCYIGVYPGWGPNEDEVDAQKLYDFQRLSGKGVTVVPFSSFWGQLEVSGRPLIEIDRYGAIPMLRLMPWGKPYWQAKSQSIYSLQKIIDGDHDWYLNHWAAVLKNYGKPVLVTFAPEMNGDWFPWAGVFQGGGEARPSGDQQKTDGPEKYAAAFRHIIDLFRSREVKNVQWVFQPSHRSHPNEPWNSMKSYYPGDDYIDWLGVSLYGVQFQDEPWEGFVKLMDAAYADLASISTNKPLMLSEWSVGEWPEKGSKAAWYAEALSSLQIRYPQIKIAIIWHAKWQNKNGTWSNLRIDSSPEALQAYREGVRSDYFIGSIKK